LSAINEELDYAPNDALACHLGLLEQWPQLQLARMLCGREVLVQAQFGPHQALAPSQHGLAVLIRYEFEQHCIEVHTYYQSGGLRSHKPLSHGDNNLGTQPHLALQ
jgi:hypothetical protein